MRLTPPAPLPILFLGESFARDLWGMEPPLCSTKMCPKTKERLGKPCFFCFFFAGAVGKAVIMLLLFSLIFMLEWFLEVAIFSMMVTYSTLFKSLQNTWYWHYPWTSKRIKASSWMNEESLERTSLCSGKSYFGGYIQKLMADTSSMNPESFEHHIRGSSKRTWSWTCFMLGWFFGKFIDIRCIPGL